MSYRLELRGITKQYPSVRANDSVNLKVRPGEIHAVLGENGAGKSTLMKIIFGAVKPDEGEILFNGQAVRIKSPQEARALGISMVFQHFSLFDTLTVAENVWLGLDKSMPLAEVTARIREVAGEYGLDIDPDRSVHDLTVGERQRVEIVRALLTNPQLLILDEPTSVLTPQAVGRLFVTLRHLAEKGCAILYISHKLDEIRALCHHCTVMRGGKVTGEVDPTQETNASLSRLMIGAEPPELHRAAPVLGAVALSVRNLDVARNNPFGVDLKGVSFELRAGEILGIAGVSGNGQQALMAVLSGEDPRAKPGSVHLFGKDISASAPGERRRLGLHSVPEERLGRGAVPIMSLAQNTLLTRTDAVGKGGWLRMKGVVGMAEALIERFNVKAGGPHALARSLSGGNLQKFIMGREISAEPKVLLVSQPTWGVDVGAAAQIRGELLKLRDAGCAVLVVSEELEELFEVSDRLMVMAQGQLSPSVPVGEATVEQIGAWMSGLWSRPATQTGGAHVQA
ncbi:ABC transporter ATP-binding protein [Aquabacterium sp.]|uniref:ABC transporter ATP-binding protein n=1 Tax=Aquabacterium sp. TaxID=1872578 RepID=UPI0035AEA417